MASEKQKVLEERQKLVDEIGSWQRKYRALKEAEGDRKEQHLNRTRHEFAGKSIFFCYFLIRSCLICDRNFF